MGKSTNLYYNLGYWLLLYIPLTLAGFSVTYFSVFLQPKAAIIHLHFGLAALWMVTVIIQPFLIKYKKLTVHRLIGKISYVVAPLLLLSGWAMLRLGYHHFIIGLAAQQENGLPKFTRQEILHEGANYILLGFVYITWLAVFYVLGVANRRKMHPHSRYMLAAALTLTGPTLDRTLFFQFGITHVFSIVPIEYVAFTLVDCILLYLLYRDRQARRNLQPLLTCLGIYIALQLMYFLSRDTAWWDAISIFMMQPRL